MIAEQMEELLKKKQTLTCIKFELINACNLKCIHCYVADRSMQLKTEYLNFEDICCVLEQVKEMGTTNIILTGGEPLLHPDFKNIVHIIKNMNFILTLFTNATLINPQNISCIEKCDLVEITRYGCSEETYETTTNTQGSYAKYLSALKLLKEHKVRFVERAMLLKTNEIDIEEFRDICGNRIGTYIFSENNDDYAAKARASDKVLVEYYKKTCSLSEYNSKPNAAVCNFAETNLSIKCNGNIVPCINWPTPLGNIQKHSIKDIWQGSQINKLREKNQFQTFKKCFECEDNIYLTHLCPSDNMYEMNDCKLVSTEKCRICRLKKQAMQEKER